MRERTCNVFVRKGLVLSICIWTIVFGFTEPEVYVSVTHSDAALHNLCVFPSSLNLTVHANDGLDVTLTLKRNVILDVNSPLYTLKSSMVTEDTSTSNLKNFAVYHDTSTGASISIQCSGKTDCRLLYTGLFRHGNSDLFIRPANPGTNQIESTSSGFDLNRQHVVSRRPDRHSLDHGYILTADSVVPALWESPIINHSVRTDDHRQRRSLKWTPYIVELLVVVDYSVYKVWYEMARGRNDEERLVNTRTEMRRYFAHIVNGMDLLYKEIAFADFEIRVNLAGYLFIEDAASYPWSETRKVAAAPKDQLEADQALKDFRSWIKNQTGLPAHDHAMLFTGYDLFTKAANSSQVSHTAGLAFIGTMCNHGDSVSIVEEHGGLQSVGTAAHELGHSLGARHDGENNDCRSADRFIMAASGFGPVPEAKRLNPWHFSKCSVSYFRSFIASLLAAGSTCLLESDVMHVPDHEAVSSYPGQEFDPDEQCRLIWGPKSYLCRGSEFGTAETICTGLYCRDPATASDCVLHTAARGTSCGNKKWCIQGVCTYSESAPEKHGCVLGDQPGIAFNGLTCSQLVYTSASYCYQEKVLARCCDSCRKHFTWRRGCEYGDRIEGCRSWHCNHVFDNRNVRQDCCATCEVGEIIWSTPPPEAGLSSTVFSVSPDVCLDVGGVNGMDCVTFTKTHGPYICYNPALARTCCLTCKHARTSSEDGCEYGDQSPQLCAQIANSTTLTCDRYQHQCCHTCVPRGDHSSSITPRAPPILVYVVVILSILTQFTP